MPDDWLVRALDDVERAAQHLVDVLGPVSQVLERGREARAAGRPLAVIARTLNSDGAEPRRAVDEAINEYRSAVGRLRGRVVRAMVDEEGVSVSELAREMSLSRQMVARLYEAAGAEAPDD